jgi:hypothetical protein
MEMGPPERRLQIPPNRATPQIAGDEHADVSGNHRLIRPFWHCSWLPHIVEHPGGPRQAPRQGLTPALLPNKGMLI